MKFGIALLSLVASFCIGAALSSVYFENKISNFKEDIVSKEMSLLSMASNVSVPCNEIRKTDRWFSQEYKGFTIFWKKSDSNAIVKFVVDDKYSSAVDMLDNSCQMK
ncbi:hypothetical protein [Vibrio rhizosphaerae]|uniref:hypothetical protein n=1 Tax=Vibrio rhizosphaerae TaxID=398736 RepID=UPI00056F5676|nr:hypothetical protein [Vibrio rhizosphaerae]